MRARSAPRRPLCPQSTSCVLNGVDVRGTECNYRAWNGPESGYGMGWHPDDCSGGLLTLDQRQTRTPCPSHPPLPPLSSFLPLLRERANTDRWSICADGPPDMLSTFTYLTDVDETTPAFAVVPKSRRIDNIQILADELGDEYAEVPIHGPAGTCCIVDRSTIHTRLDPLELDKDKQRSRRLYHHVRPRLAAPLCALCMPGMII